MTTEGNPIGRVRSLIALLAVPAMLLVGCGSDTPEPPAATTKAPAASPLEGTWRTGSVSPRDTEATLRRQGFGKFVKDYRANAPFSTDTVLELSIEDGQWNLYGETEEGREPIDYDAEYEIDGDTVTFHHSDGSNTHRWTVDGERLSLEFVKGTMPPYEGIPDEVFQRALYMTETFTRQG
jgi:hypothetical protein